MALVEDQRIEARSTGRLVPLKVAADVVIFMGAMVAVNAAGYAVPAEDTAGLVVIGVAQQFVDNLGGGDGGQTVRVQKGVFGLPNSAVNAVTQADVGRDAYVEDDGTVANDGVTNGIVAGVVDELGSDGLVYVHFA